MAQNVTIARSSAHQRNAEPQSSTRNEGNALIRSVAAIFLFVAVSGFPGAVFPVAAAPSASQAQSSTRLQSQPQTIFPKLRSIDLSTARTLATKRSSAIAIAEAKIGAAQSDLKDQQNHFKLNTAGGIDPFSGQVRFYLNLDMERLLGLNKAAKSKAKRAVEAEQISKTTATNGAVKDVTVAWYSLQRTQAGVIAAARYLETAEALYVSTDAKFKAGSAELSGVLSALEGKSKSQESYQAARHAVVLACLDLAQACGYTTAEEMEAAL